MTRQRVQPRCVFGYFTTALLCYNCPLKLHKKEQFVSCLKTLRLQHVLKNRLGMAAAVLMLLMMMMLLLHAAACDADAYGNARRE